MNKNEKQGLIGLAIIAAVLLVGGYFIYKIFFTYGSYAECVGDRTLKPGMSNQQVSAQEDYCRDYFKDRPKKEKKLTLEEKKDNEEFAMKNCTDPSGVWIDSIGKSKPNGSWISCDKYKYLSKCVSRLDNGKLFYLPYSVCKK